MKHIYNFLLILTTVFFFACQEEDDMSSSSGVGYLRLNIDSSNEVTTKAYDAEQFAVIITNTETSKVAFQTTDASLIAANEKTPIELPAGTYKIEAKSYNYEGTEVQPGADRPYYAGITENVVVKAGEETAASVVCKLANVKVTVNFAEDVVTAFEGRSLSVGVKGGEYNPVTFTPETSGADHSVYFPVVDLVATLSATNPTNVGQPFTDEHKIEGVTGNTHYILNYALEQGGTGDFTVTFDPTYNQYNFTVYVNPKATVGAVMNASAWDRLVYLTAENVSAGSMVSTEGLKFQYREKAVVATQTDEDTTPWKDATATEKDGKYTAIVTGLTASKEYEYRLANSEGVAIGSVQTFETDAEDAKTPLQNGGFEDWCTIQIKGLFGGNVNTAYPNASGSVSYWDTSNKGANSMNTQNPTSQETETVKEGTSAAKLQSKKVIIAFAAASLYTGSFGSANTSTMSATVNFGHEPFNSRPIALHGYYKYTPVVIDNIDEDKIAAGELSVKKGDMDECSIYIALATSAITVDNSDVNKLFKPEDDRIIAYGALPSGAATNETANNGYKEFTIPLQYKESKFGVQPTHIIVVCSASKYGDYMTGGAGSTLLVDDFSLVYDGTPTIWEGK